MPGSSETTYIHRAPMDFRTIRLIDIDLHALTPCKVTLAHYGAQDHSRWVFRGTSAGSSNTFFYKIWNPAYVRRDNILAAIESGFYDERLVPALYGAIFHNGLCRGYVMHEGTIRQNAPSQEFREFVFSRTVQTGFFAVQFSHCHTMIYKDKWSLLDLEGVYPIECFPRLSQYRCAFEDHAYEQLVAGLYRQSSSNSVSTLKAAAYNGSLAAASALATGTPPGASSAVRRLCRRLSRRIARKFRNMMPHIHLIEH